MVHSLTFNTFCKRKCLDFMHLNVCSLLHKLAEVTAYSMLTLQTLILWSSPKLDLRNLSITLKFSSLVTTFTIKTEALKVGVGVEGVGSVVIVIYKNCLQCCFFLKICCRSVWNNYLKNQLIHKLYSNCCWLLQIFFCSNIWTGTLPALCSLCNCSKIQ